MVRSLPVENLLPQNVYNMYYHRMCTGCVADYQLRAVMLLKQQDGELPVAVYYRQLRTPASETADPIDCRTVPPEFNVLHGANAGDKSQVLLQPLGRERATIGMPGQRSACATTQVIMLHINQCLYRSIKHMHLHVLLYYLLL